ncbi:dachshund homolog 1-like isoform X2 [Tubulanus polymorphus]|uniref:dachshund homolog 1-like isoform X2 n=1 Tax=Tubulanus polymorphus TaxID=672921 RepID=UPI003DA52F1C
MTCHMRAMNIMNTMLNGRTALSPGASPPHHAINPALYREDIQPLSLKMEKPSYSSPPPVASNHPDNNVCKMIEYRGAKVAAFSVDGRELICLPQAFELFLKHLVGGLHTVYTKLKRLEVTPIVCNVEQVRILRGLGAIQPGVNRCKLISCKEFDILYDDCTNSSARPGRPPKRSPAVHASPDTLDKLKKSRLDTDYLYSNRLLAEKTHGIPNGYHHYPPHLGMLPFLPVSYSHMSSAASMVMNHPHLGVNIDPTLKERTRADVDSISPSSHGENHPFDEHHHREDIQHHHIRHDALPTYRHSPIDKESGTPSDLSVNGPIDLKKHVTTGSGSKQESDRSDDDDDDDHDDMDDDLDRDSTSPNRDNNNGVTNHESHSVHSQQKQFPQPTSNISADDLPQGPPSSLEALLLNIQGLMKVALEHSKQYDRQVHMETAELKMEYLRQRELRENLERRLMEEQKLAETFQKRWKKEKKTRRKLQEQIEARNSVAANNVVLREQNGATPTPNTDEPARMPSLSPEDHQRFMMNVFSAGTSVTSTTSNTVQTSTHSPSVIQAIKTNG